MPYVKVYFYCDIENIPENDAHDICVFGLVKKEFLDKYYKCMDSYVTEEEFDLKDSKEFLKKVLKTYNFKENPLNEKHHRKLIKKYKTHRGLSIGDVIMVDKRFYSISETKFIEIEEPKEKKSKYKS